jgi:beta-lactamase class A
MRILTLSLLIVLSFLTSCTDNKQVVIDKIQNILQQEKGTFAVAFKNIETGEEILINGHEMFHAASTMKTPVMIEVFKQAEQGKFSLQDSITLKNEFKSIVDGSSFSLDPEDDSEKDLYSHLGEKRSIGQLMYDMIIVSSNLATNLIIEKVDARDVTATMRSIGAKDIQVLRGVEDGKAFEKGLNNETSAYDLMVMFEKIVKEEMVSNAASAEMTRILLDQKFNEIIPARLPKDVKVAHKTGSVTGVRHDCGIVFLPDGRKYVVVLLSKEMEDVDAGIRAMAEVSAMLYQRVIQAD